MKNEVYCSTGTIVGRATGYDFSVIKTVLPSVCKNACADGIEHVFITPFYDRLSDVRNTILSSGLKCAVLHADKSIGSLLSNGNAEDTEEALRLFEINCAEAKNLGAKRVVFHLWGMPASDRNFAANLDAMPKIMQIADRFGIELMIENIPSVVSDPISRWRELEAFDCSFTYDVRFGQLHGQNDIIPCSNYLKSGKISHIHISDFGGETLDFSKIRPILHPGEGKVDFRSLFANLKNSGYSGTFTLESPVMYEDRLDPSKLERTLSWLCREVERINV